MGQDNLKTRRSIWRARSVSRSAGHRWFPCLLAATLLFLPLAGCSFGPRLPPANLAEPGWRVRQGQAVWRRDRSATELAGEILLATHADGRTVAQFTKNPLPFLSAQTTTNRWQIEFIPQQRVYRGSGPPPARLIWLHLARSLSGIAPPGPLHFETLPAGGWRLENEHSGETLTGFLAMNRSADFQIGGSPDAGEASRFRNRRSKVPGFKARDLVWGIFAP